MTTQSLAYCDRTTPLTPFYLTGSGKVTKEPETLNKIPVNRAILVAVFAELTEFGLFLFVYFIAYVFAAIRFNKPQQSMH